MASFSGKKSKVWNYFTIHETKESTVCKLCSKEYKYTAGTGNMWLHLKTAHNIDNPDSKYFVEKPKLNQQSLPQLLQSQRKYERTSERSIKITRKLAEFIVKDMRPFDQVQSSAFRQFCSEMDPRFDLPSSHTIKKVISCIYEETKQKVSQEASEIQFLSLTTDAWTSVANDGFLAVSAHGLDQNWDLRRFVLAVVHLKERHTASYIAEELLTVAKELGVSPVVITTDNGSNIKAAARHNNWIRFPCYAHTLNIAVQAGLDVEEIATVLGKAKTIVAHFKHSSVASAKLKETVKLLKQENSEDSIGKCTALVQEVPTRWNSCFDMLQRLLVLKPALMAVLHDGDLIPLPADWKLMKELCEILEPIKLSTETLGGDHYPTMSIAYPSIMKILGDLAEDNREGLSEVVGKFKKAIFDSINSHFQDEAQRELMEVCCFLDPRFKKLDFLNRESKVLVHQTIKQFAKEFTKSDSTTSESRKRSREEDGEEEPPAKKSKQELYIKLFGAKVVSSCESGTSSKKGDKTQQEMERYLSDPGIAIDDSPLEWWKRNSERYPVLSQLARKYLGVPATSVPCERLFSSAGRIISKQRAALKPGTAEMMVYLKANLQ